MEPKYIHNCFLIGGRVPNESVPKLRSRTVSCNSAHYFISYNPYITNILRMKKY